MRSVDVCEDLFSRRCVREIVRVLMQRPGNEINITALVRELRSNHLYVARCLRLMEGLGMVEILRIGRLRMVRLVTGNEIVRKLIERLGAEPSRRAGGARATER